MPGLLDNIAADAEARLPHAADRAPRDELARYKKFLKDWSLKLRFEHRGGAGGRDICQARSAVLDALLRHLGDALHAHHVTAPASVRLRWRWSPSAVTDAANSIP
jgi:hypothetical protein